MEKKLKNIVDENSNIVFFGGAGVSTESGIPDFRSESGLYYAQKKYGYSPEQILSHTFFMTKTKEFYRYYRENMIYPEARPNPAHKALALLEARGKVKAVVTQNIDGLHQLAGSQFVYELHGSIHRNSCVRCGSPYPLAEILGSKEEVPLCHYCGGIIKPEVVLYEEALDDGVVESALEAIRGAEVLIVGGTSLSVYPAAGLLRYFSGRELVLINRTPTDRDKEATLVLHEDIGKVFSEFL